MLFRIIPKIAPETERGPVIFTHGMFSSPEDFLMRTNYEAPATPIQLAAMGYDVWIGCTRGRSITSGHAFLS